MLSYRHAFHAGNFADVLKHWLLMESLNYLTQKPTAVTYIDTHSGAGLYALAQAHSQKLGEYREGIQPLLEQDWPELDTYKKIIRHFNPQGTFEHYPGSPLIAQQLLRAQDRAWLHELHPQDYALLRQSTAKDRRLHVCHQDGYAALNALLPPESRRGLVLIDPSYELKTDYQKAVEVLVNVYKKFPTGTYLLWYPVVERQRSERMIQALVKSGIPHIQQFELAVRKDSAERGMTASGVLMINPPWRLLEKAQGLLLKVAQLLSQDEGACALARVLVPQ